MLKQTKSYIYSYYYNTFAALCDMILKKTFHLFRIVSFRGVKCPPSITVTCDIFVGLWISFYSTTTRGLSLALW